MCVQRYMGFPIHHYITLAHKDIVILPLPYIQEQKYRYFLRRDAVYNEVEIYQTFGRKVCSRFCPLQ